MNRKGMFLGWSSIVAIAAMTASGAIGAAAIAQGETNQSFDLSAAYGDELRAAELPSHVDLEALGEGLVGDSVKLIATDGAAAATYVARDRSGALCFVMYLEAGVDEWSAGAVCQVDADLFNEHGMGLRISIPSAVREAYLIPDSYALQFDEREINLVIERVQGNVIFVDPDLSAEERGNAVEVARSVALPIISEPHAYVTEPE